MTLCFSSSSRRVASVLEALRGQERLRQPRPAGRDRLQTRAIGQRPVPRLGQGLRPALLRPPAQGHEDQATRRVVRATSHASICQSVWLDPCPLPRPLWPPAIISGYMGRSDRFDEAIADFSIAYADQARAWDHAALKAAVSAGHDRSPNRKTGKSSGGRFRLHWQSAAGSREKPRW